MGTGTSLITGGGKRKKAPASSEDEAGAQARRPARRALDHGRHTFEVLHNAAGGSHHLFCDGGQGEQRLVAGADLIAELAEFAAHGLGMARHPDDMPGQHGDGEEQDAGGEDFLSGALEHVGNGTGE